MSYPTEHPPVPPQNGPMQHGSGFATGQQGQYVEGMNESGASPSSKKRLTLIVSGVVGLAVVIAGVLFAMNFFRSTAAPADGLPGNASLVLQVELNPNDAKKLEIYQLLTKFPTIKEKLNQESFTADPLKAIWDSLVGPDTKISYDADIKTWIGDSIGVAAVIKDGTPKPVIAIHTKDAKKAKNFFDTKFKEINDRDNVSATISGSFVILTPTGDEALADEVKNNPLSKSAKYKEDMSHLADRGLVSLWADDEFFKAASKTTKSGIDDSKFQGRVAASISVTSDSLQFNSWATSSEPVSNGDVRELVSGLPASSDLVVAGAFDGNFVKGIVEGLRSSSVDYSQFEEIIGEDLETGMTTLLGSQSAFVAEVESFANASRAPEKAGLALVTKSDDTSKQESIWKTFGRKTYLDVQFQEKNGVSVASLNPTYADKVINPTEKLGDKESFKSALDMSKPVVGLVYFEPKATFDMFRSAMPQQSIEDLNAVSSIGLTAAKADDKSASLVLKVFVKG